MIGSTGPEPIPWHGPREKNPFFSFFLVVFAYYFELGTMRACAHAIARPSAPHVTMHVLVGASGGSPTCHGTAHVGMARWNAGKGKNGTWRRRKTAAMPQEEQQAHPTNEDAQMHLEEAEKEETWFDEGEEEEEEDASALDMTDEEAQAWEQGSGLTAEEDYVTSGNRVVLDACDDLFEMVEEEMKVRQTRNEGPGPITHVEATPRARPRARTRGNRTRTSSHVQRTRNELTAKNMANCT